ncbi:MAG: flavin reductase [Saprospiraceae bacterium]|nr:flavin reductase [Saprospiraceae bacterium]
MRRPWNIVDQPVYSLATRQAGRLNMNICTYATAVSRRPKMYVVALEHGSRSTLNLKKTGEGVLQLLTAGQRDLIRPLGYRSGNSFDKHAWLADRELLTLWHGYPVLRDTAARLWLRVEGIQRAGDHELFCCALVRSTTQTESGILMFQDLVQQGLILS